jgi:phosphoribosylamine--glycine ligase
MRVLVIGSGGREHALVWKIAQSPALTHLYAAPGSVGMSGLATCFPDVGVNDTPAIVKLCQGESIDLVVVGPEDPLANGLADTLRDAGFAVFGPSAYAAQLEGSKRFSKEFMQRHQIPTADFQAFSDLEAANTYVRELAGPCVVKADGLAAGKGVVVCEGDDATQMALDALQEIMGDRRFGAAGAEVVIEELLLGEELSFYAISDGERIVNLTGAQDHKRALDGDQGENTGGMGAYSPAPVLSAEVEQRIVEEVVEPTITGMREVGHPFVGVLFVGLMITEDGTPKVIEFNVRFGDPETQPLMVRLESDFLPVLADAASGSLSEDTKLSWGEAAVCVVLASAGYPRSYETGKLITGIEDAESDDAVTVFQAGTKPAADGSVQTSGGRVLGVTARGASVRQARDHAYAAASKIHFEGVQLRRDIAHRALTPSGVIDGSDE